MSLRLVLGRSGAGKTSTCMKDIRQQLQMEPTGDSLIMLVPEQATFQTEYELLAQAGVSGTIRAQVLSFRRLALRVMQETGGTALVPITENGKHMLLYKLISRASKQLKLFAGAAEQHGFIEKLNELLAEWKRYGVQADHVPLREEESPLASGPREGVLLGRKLHDLHYIYQALEQELEGKYIDSEDYLSWLTKGSAEAELLRGAHIWVDGFDSFTPKELEALGQLLQHARHVTITLHLERPYAASEAVHELDLFYTPARTCQQLLLLAEQLGIEVEEPVVLAGVPRRFAASLALAHLEQHYEQRMPLLDTGRRTGGGRRVEDELSVHAAVSRRAEVEACARDLRMRVQEQGLRWRDCMIMARDAADYNDYIGAVFADYGIPFYLDQSSKALQHPLTEFIRSALETTIEGWRYEAVFRCIKTELLMPEDGRLTRESFDRLENYVLAVGIDGKSWSNESRWKPLVFDPLEGKGGEIRASDLEQMEELMAARAAVIEPLQRFERQLRRAADVEGMCRAVYRLLDEIGAAERLEQWSQRDTLRGDLVRARQHRQLWDGVMNLLDQLVELTGEEKLPLALFGGMLEAGLESLQIASIPPTLDQVLIGSLDRTHTGDIRICYVLGANDGVLPMRHKEDGLLTEQEREKLAASGMPLAPGARRRLLDERYLIYKALTKPSQHLWVSYALSDEEGKSLLPSELIHFLRLMYPGLRVQMLPAEPQAGMTPGEQLAFAAIPQRALSHLLGQLRLWQQGQEIAEEWWELYNWLAAHPEYSKRLRALLTALFYTNEEQELSANIAEGLYGLRLQASVSRLERFVSCPFQHFAIHGLKLRERQLYRLGAPDIGQLFHAALSKLAASLGESWGRATERQLRSEAAAAVEELAPRLQSNILTSSSRFQYMARKLTEIVSQAAVVLGEHARRAQFVPVGLELDFGREGGLPPLVLPVDGQRELELIGRIDRVDAAETEEGVLLRVLDYKSSQTSLRLEEVAYGLSLQLLAYLDVLITHAPLWLGRPAKPAGVLYFHVHNPLLSSANRLEEEEARKQLLKRFKLKGLVLADGEAVRMMDGELESGYSELLPVALKRDGGFYSSSSVVTDEQWRQLRGSVRRTIRSIGKRIAQGEVAIAPYKMGDKAPCAYCAYKPVCQFDPLFAGNQYVRLAKCSDAKVWETLAAGGEEGEHEFIPSDEASGQHLDG